MRTEKRIRGIRTLALACVLALTACDTSPTEPLAETPSDESAVATEALAAEAVEASWSELVSADELHLETLEAASRGRAPVEARGHFLDAGALAAEIEDARRSDRTDLAVEMTILMEEAYLAAALEIHGAGLVAEALAGVEAALASVEAAVAAAAPAPEVASRLTAARDAARSARNRAARGDRAGTLRDAARASDALRDLRPEERAKAMVVKAHRLLEKAHELAGPEPREEIAALLDAADAACERARAALDGEEWRKAAGQARACGRTAHRVISLLSGGMPDDRLADRAASVVEYAAEALARATEMAGDDPRPEIAAALRNAAEFLADARAALEAEAWREAIHDARRSVAVSRRVVAVLSGDGPGHGSHERVEALVVEANEVLQRAQNLAGPDVGPPISERLRQAEAMVAKANEELRHGRLRAAFHHARRALHILRRIIAVLS